MRVSEATSSLTRANGGTSMGWLDANEYLMLETLGAERVEDIHRAANASRGDTDEPAVRTPRRFLSHGGVW